MAAFSIGLLKRFVVKRAIQQTLAKAATQFGANRSTMKSITHLSTGWKNNIKQYQADQIRVITHKKIGEGAGLLYDLKKKEKKIEREPKKE